MLLTLTISLAALFALAGLFQFQGSRRDARQFPPPGRLVDIGGRRLHARVEGSGSPAVVFEAGISASSVNWLGVQPQVARFTTTVCYDRAGLGWSDAPRGVFDTDRILADLATLLEKLNVAGPYVLVGHSYGGLLVRIFAERYPEKVAGLVLIDPVLACTWENPDPAHARKKKRAVRIARSAGWCARFGLVRLVTSPALAMGVVVPMFSGRNEEANGIVDRLRTEMVKLPAATVEVVRSHWCRPKNFRAMVAHLGALKGSFSALQNLPLKCPVTVISARDLTPDGLAEHRSIAALSPRGQHIIAQGSGHWVQFDEPELVVDAIRRVMS